MEPKHFWSLKNFTPPIQQYFFEDFLVKAEKILNGDNPITFIENSNHERESLLEE